MEPDAFPIRHETLLTAAKRVVRFIRVDDEHDGGLLSKATIIANETLAQMIEQEERKATNALSSNPPQQ
jgi:hypothetical protein